MQQNIMRVIRKRRLWATYKKSKQYEEYLAYKAVEKETKKLVLQAKKKFEKKLAKEAKKKPKMFYSYLRSKTSNRSSVGPLKDNDAVVSQDTGMANVLNKFFVSVFTVEMIISQRWEVVLFQRSWAMFPFRKKQYQRR